jgi:hypothetical protein
LPFGAREAAYRASAFRQTPSNIDIERTVMKLAILAFVFAAGMTGCTTQQMSTDSPSTMGASGASRLQSRMCQTFRSYEDRSAGGELQEACNRQLGVEMCTRCLASGI